jgi:hypothetical protein
MKTAANGNQNEPMSDPEAPEGVETRLRKYWSAPDPALIAGVVLAAAGVILLAASVWLWGVLALVLAVAVFALRLEAGRRGTGAALGRLSAHRRVAGARSRGQIELFRLRRELAELQAERNAAYQELGRATHAGDAAAARDATAQVDDLSARIEAKEAEITALQSERRERVRRAQGGEAPPEPARVPEPFPPPDEGTPPEPARVPEPFPEPVPEPGPADPPTEPEHPPAPETARRDTRGAPNT